MPLGSCPIYFPAASACRSSRQMDCRTPALEPRRRPPQRRKQGRLTNPSTSIHLKPVDTSQNQSLVHRTIPLPRVNRGWIDAYKRRCGIFRSLVCYRLPSICPFLPCSASAVSSRTGFHEIHFRRRRIPISAARELADTLSRARISSRLAT